jgi:hypothetical protein
VPSQRTGARRAVGGARRAARNIRGARLLHALILPDSGSTAPAVASELSKDDDTPRDRIKMLQAGRCGSGRA